MDTTLLKGLTLLELLVAAEQPCGISELAEQLKWAKSNVHRVLQTLIHVGYVKQDAATGRYECTLKLWELGTLVSERIDIRAVARPHVETLAAKTHETVHLSIMDGIDVLYLDKVDSAHAVRAYTRVGGRAPAYCVATGKALLAYAPESNLQEVLKQLINHSPRTITDPQQLRKELARVRDSGYAVNRGEWRESVFGVAAPVLDGNGHAVAAIGISGPSDRLNARCIREFAPLVVRAARAIAAELGFTVRRQAGAGGR